MKKPVGRVFTLILGWLFVILLFVFFIQAREYYGSNPILRKRLSTVEAFESPPVVVDSPDIYLQNVTPGDATLNKPREPYSLLGNWLTLTDAPKYMNAKECHEADFQGRLERTGNFRQLTNNYKRGDPDSCSGPIQDLTFAIYKTEPIPNTECIQPFVE